LHLAQADEKIAVARQLLASGHLGDAAGRAYYAMFHAAQDLLRSKNLHAKTHRGTFSLLSQNFEASLGPQLRAYKQAMTMREEGD
jgi:uncharacterized protein (UPF0332 family)